jgi:hypothetical protein
VVAQQINWSAEPLGLELLEPGEERTQAPIIEAPRVAASEFPEMIDSPYVGSANVAGGRPKSVELKFILQTQAGDLGGTVEFQDCRRRKATQFQFQGAVNREGVFVLNGSASGASVAILSGTLARDGRTIVGNYVVKSPGEPLEAGTFTARRS